MFIPYSIRKFNEHRKTKGFWGTIRYAIQSYLGIRQNLEEVETLRYFFKKYHKLTDIVETDDEELRILQKCDALLLGIIDKLCLKHGLTCWADYGTLLGAVRHKGFIPWDDDTDLAMPRKDFSIAVDVLKKEMEPMGFSVDYYNGEKLNRLNIHYKHKDTGIWADIFPLDEVSSSLDFNDLKDNLSPLIKKYSRYYQMNVAKKSESSIWAHKQKNIIDPFLGEGNDYMFHGGEFPFKLLLVKKEWVYPLKRAVFENVKLNIPFESGLYLKELYGSDYMDFPKTGVEHHALGRLPLQKWHLQSGIDMYKVYDYLLECYEKICP